MYILLVCEGREKSRCSNVVILSTCLKSLEPGKFEGRATHASEQDNFDEKQNFDDLNGFCFGIHTITVLSKFHLEDKIH